LASDVFGPYAQSAEAELASSTDDIEENDLPESATAANSNTAPAAAATKAEPESAPTHVDLVLKRETATVSLPLEAAAASDGLIGRLGRALGGMEAATAPAQPPRLPAASITDSPTDTEASHAEVETDTGPGDSTAMARRLRPATGSA
jgi:hypothetical protein